LYVWSIEEAQHLVFLPRKLTEPGQPAVPEQEPQRPAVPIRKSVTAEYIVCLEDGKKLKMLKRHLRSTYGMISDEYRAKWGLPADYPMVAPAYAEKRSAFAKSIGLGRSRSEPEPEATLAKRSRRRAAA
jgi:predicted transcriptional regulator